MQVLIKYMVGPPTNDGTLIGFTPSNSKDAQKKNREKET